MEVGPEINVFKPNVEEGKIRVVAKTCGDNKLEWEHLLDIGATLALIRLCYDEQFDVELYKEAIELAEVGGKFLINECLDNRQRVRAIIYALKPMVLTMMYLEDDHALDAHLHKSSGEEKGSKYFIPAVDLEAVERLSNICMLNGVNYLELLDIAISWFNADEAIAYMSMARETGYLDHDRVIDGAQVGKMLIKTMKGDSRGIGIITATLLLLKASMINMLGGCGKC